MSDRWSVVAPERLFRRLVDHLFPGDGDEHAAIVSAGVAQCSRGTRLLVRDVVLARDGTDFVASSRAYRMLTAQFVRDHIMRCRDERLVYLAVHNHGPGVHVAFSESDLRSHERGYPALRDIARGMPVGALVFADAAVAGDIWLPDERRVSLSHLTVVGTRLQRFTPEPAPMTSAVDPRYDRQSRLLGDRGQALLQELKVGVVGAGGVGSVVVELLGRLGVGHIVVVDPQRADATNIPRLIGSRWSDAMTFLTRSGNHPLLRRLGQSLAKRKVSLARRQVLRANPNASVEVIAGDFLESEHANRFRDCDFIFLAADNMHARLLFNAIVHQYLVPGAQIGAKVIVDSATGDIQDVYCTARHVIPDAGCLVCNGFVPAGQLADEVKSEKEREHQKYVDDPGLVAPSVISLNTVAASLAVNDFLFSVAGLTLPGVPSRYTYFRPRERGVSQDTPRMDRTCLHCGDSRESVFARGDDRQLPTRG